MKNAPRIKPHVFLITKMDVENSDNLDDNDVGKWGLIINGALLTPCDTEELAFAYARAAAAPHPRAKVAIA